MSIRSITLLTVLAVGVVGVACNTKRPLAKTLSSAAGSTQAMTKTELMEPLVRESKLSKASSRKTLEPQK